MLLVSEYYDLQSLARFASVSRKSFPLSIPLYLSTSPEARVVNAYSLVLSHSPTFTLRCYSCQADLELFHSFGKDDFNHVEECLMYICERLSTACMQYALGRVSSKFDYCEFFETYKERLDVRLWRIVFSSKTDESFPLRTKRSTLHHLFNDARERLLTFGGEDCTPTVKQILFASSLRCM